MVLPFCAALSVRTLINTSSQYILEVFIVCNDCDFKYTELILLAKRKGALPEFKAFADIAFNVDPKMKYLAQMGLHFSTKSGFSEPETSEVRLQFPQFQIPEVEKEIESIVSQARELSKLNALMEQMGLGSGGMNELAAMMNQFKQQEESGNSKGLYL